MPRLEDYPYDPELEVEQLVGLEKLRAVRDRGVAKLLFGLYFDAQKNAGDPNYLSRRRAADNARMLADKRRTVGRALRGEFGRALGVSLKQLGFDAEGPPEAIERALGIIREQQDKRHP